MSEKKVFGLIVFMYAILLISITFVITNSVLIINDDANTFVIKTYKLNNLPDNLKYRRLSHSDENIYKFTAEIKKENLIHLKDDTFKVIVYRMTGLWYKIKFNDIVIGTAGNLYNNRSNIWNCIHSFDLDKSLINDINTIEITVYGTYEIGLAAFPVLIVTNKKAMSIMNWFSMFIRMLYSISAGILIYAFILMMFFWINSNYNRPYYLFYSISTLLMSFSILDNILIYDTIISTLLFKKLIIFFIYSATFCISMALYLQFKKRINLVLGYLLLFTTCIILFFCKDMISFYKAFTYCNILVLLNVLFWLYPCIINFRRSIYAKVILIATFMLLLLSGFDIITIIFKDYPIFSLTPFAVLSFSLIIIFLVSFDYIYYTKLANEEAAKSQHLYERTTHDEKTGAHTHKFLIQKIDELQTPYSIMMIDLDDFKSINDNYGHLIGDDVLKLVVNTILQHVRQSDIVSRYGGDEFSVLLPGCSLSRAKMIASSFLNSIISDNIVIHNEVVKIGLSIGIYYNADFTESSESALKKADCALYISKNGGKGIITAYDDSMTCSPE